jgi:hypothetical protein
MKNIVSGGAALIALASFRAIGCVITSMFTMLSATLFAQTTCPFNPRAVNATDRAVATLARAMPAPSASAVADHIDGNVAALDVDGDGEFTNVDGVVISRYLNSFRGNALVTGLTIPAIATRRDATSIAKFISDGCTADLPVMPIEVIGPASYIKTITLMLGDATNVNRLWLQCHRCGWHDSTVQSGLNRGAKASVRLNGGTWVEINNATAAVEQPEKSYGGIGGGYNTARFTIPITGVRKEKIPLNSDSMRMTG